MIKSLRHPILVAVATLSGVAVLAGPDRPSEFTNQNGIVNTRHNMTQRSSSGADLLAAGPNAGGAAQMDASRNNYGEVCVYCHTPHGANTNAAAPLWNRTLPTGTTYQTYNTLQTSSLSQNVYQPGAGSLPCLSCHDGSQAIDQIINMPGSGNYNATPDANFSETWERLDAPGFYGLGGAVAHLGLQADGNGCLACHQPSGVGAIFPKAADFTVFAIGTDLRNDHPVGVTFPSSTGVGTDWKTPSGTVTRGSWNSLFFDDNGNTHMDKGELRLYDTGHGPSVECASCHDPHGVPSAGAGSVMNPTFLRKTNTSSTVCLTCHTK